MKHLFSTISFALALALGGCGDDEAGTSSERPAAQRESEPTSIAPVDDAAGRAVYVHYCADCHDAGPGHPGTMQLAIRLGAENSVLRERAGLSRDYVKVVVRNGFQMMPAFRPTEIADAELDALAAYVALGQGESASVVE